MILDLFAGPGGWDEGLRLTGRTDVVGIEWDAAACRTRAAAGHLTIRGDVAQYPTEPFAGKIATLIASPPCQAWSVAGSGGGEKDKALVFECIDLLAQGIDKRAELLVGCVDPRSLLVCEVLRWALDLQPDILLCEQVPPVLELWERIAGHLAAAGWRSTWTGKLNSADYGVPQTRERAILIAGRTSVLQPPEPTHCKGGADTLFGALLPWVSMAEAVPWICGGWPNLVVKTGTNSMVTGRTYEDLQPYQRSVGEPAPTVDRKAGGAWRIELDRRQTGAPVLDPTEVPCPTLTAAAIGKGVWDIKLVNGAQEHATARSADEPAPTLTASMDNGDTRWVHDRPATTIAGDPRCFPPGGHIANDGRDNSRMVGRSENAIKLTERDGAILQGFPPDYPWQGTKHKRWEQIGNAIPPPFAAAILTAAQVTP